MSTERDGERHLPGGWSGGFQPPPRIRAAGCRPSSRQDAGAPSGAVLRQYRRIPEPRRARVFGRERRRSDFGPVDAEVGVVPEDAAVAGGVVEGGALVDEVGLGGEGAEAVGEAVRDPEDELVLVRQLLGVPLAEGGGATADVDGDVEEGAAGAADELPLRVGLLVVQAADD